MNKQTSETAQLSKKLGSEIFYELSNSKQVSVAKVVKDENNDVAADSTQHILAGDKVAQLKKLLLNDQGYYFNKTKKCLFIPQVAFRFEGGKQLVIMFSLSCNQIKVIEGENTIVLDYDPMADQLNLFCREILDQFNK